MPRKSPLSAEVAGDLRTLIATEEWEDGRLPSETELAKRLGVSRTTVREALWLLWSEGLLNRQWGVGTFVRGQKPEGVGMGQDFRAVLRDLITSAGYDPSIPNALIEQRPCPSEAAAALNLDEGQPVWFLDRTFAADSNPVVRFWDWMPLVINGRRVDPTATKDLEHDLISFLSESAGCRILRMEAHLRAEGISEEVAETLGRPVGTPIISAVQLCYDDRDRTVVYSQNFYTTDVLPMRLLRNLHR
jgi:GntR family transcriptional regulator